MNIVCFMCVLVCTDQLGVENGDIPDENFEASDSARGNDPHNARLNNQGAWISYNPNAWIQVDIGYTTSVSGLLTQGGSPIWYDWITQLSVSTFTAADGPEVFIMDENGNDKVICIAYCAHSYFYTDIFTDLLLPISQGFKFAAVGIYT